MYLAVMGYGTVGSGVVEVLNMNKTQIAQRSTVGKLEVKQILDLRDFPGDPNESKFTKDFKDILSDEDIKIVVETMGGLHPAFEFVSDCLKAGKHVVTSNKELVAKKGYELIELAKSNNVNFLFEAAVGGGIPVIRPIEQCLAANDITEIAGILNGTTNFILTMMIEKNMTFDDALKLAQEKGYAEKDPTADIEGFDACRKICILATLAFGKHIYPESVSTQGITKISLKDIAYVNAYDSVIKLLGVAKKISDKKTFVAVYPAVIKNGSQLSSVSDVFNAVLIRGNAVGDVVFYGQGAGKLPTASAVVADVIDCARNDEKRKPIFWEDAGEDDLVISELSETAVYIRAKLKAEKDSAVAEIEEKIGRIELLTYDGAEKDEIAFITERKSEKELKDAINSIGEIETISVIRVTDY